MWKDRKTDSGAFTVESLLSHRGSMGCSRSGTYKRKGQNRSLFETIQGSKELLVLVMVCLLFPTSLSEQK